MNEQVKKRGVDLVVLLLAGALGLGGFYGYVMIRNHNLLDQAILEILQNSAEIQNQAQEVAPLTP